jgi:putative polyketide hydroxylase
VMVTADSRWKDHAAKVSRLHGISVECIVVGSDVVLDEAVFLDASGLAASGGALVRPDGYIAWRASELPPNACEALEVALRQVSAAR